MWTISGTFLPLLKRPKVLWWIQVDSSLLRHEPETRLGDSTGGFARPASNGCTNACGPGGVAKRGQKVAAMSETRNNTRKRSPSVRRKPPASKRDEILRILGEHRSNLEQFGVKSLALFGSIARDEADGNSDVDILVEFARPVGFFAFFGLQSYLENLLGCKVDLGTPDSLKPTLRERVLKEALYVA